MTFLNVSCVAEFFSMHSSRGWRLSPEIFQTSQHYDDERFKGRPSIDPPLCLILLNITALWWRFYYLFIQTVMFWNHIFLFFLGKKNYLVFWTTSFLFRFEKKKFCVRFRKHLFWLTFYLLFWNHFFYWKANFWCTFCHFKRNFDRKTIHVQTSQAIPVNHQISTSPLTRIACFPCQNTNVSTHENLFTLTIFRGEIKKLRKLILIFDFNFFLHILENVSQLLSIDKCRDTFTVTGI